ncbi:DUF637 domain-containing protein, partial [Pseudomonas japonica]|uniref:DUF637 domain-containing protein n=1 Tax=Pseudomonas japonica TaxID=256466 RepID=UPI0015E3A9BB
LAWTSAKGKGNTDETLRQSELVAKGDVAINAVNGLHIDVKQVNQQTVSQAIDAMVKADPQLAWLKDAEKRGDVDWRQVKEIHDSFKYSQSGLGAGAQLALAIALAALTGGARASLVGATSSFTAGFANAALVAVETTAANSAISNKGDLGTILKDTTSSSSLRGYLVSGLTGGIAGTLGYDPTALKFDLNSAGQVIVKAGADSLVQTAINGGSLQKNLADSLLGAAIDIGGAIAANKLGNTTLADGSPTKVAAHALLGGLKSMAMGGDFQTGAVAGGANEAMVQYLASLVLPDNYDAQAQGTLQARANLLAISQLVGVLSAVVTGGDAVIAANIAASATQYNYLSHSGLDRAARELVGCGADGDCAQKAYARYHELSESQLQAAFVACSKDPGACAQVSKTIAQAQADTQLFRAQADEAPAATREKLNMLIA